MKKTTNQLARMAMMLLFAVLSSVGAWATTLLVRMATDMIICLPFRTTIMQ